MKLPIWSCCFCLARRTTTSLLSWASSPSWCSPRRPGAEHTQHQNKRKKKTTLKKLKPNQAVNQQTVTQKQQRVWGWDEEKMGGFKAFDWSQEGESIVGKVKTGRAMIALTHRAVAEHAGQTTEEKFKGWVNITEARKLTNGWSDEIRGRGAERKTKFNLCD